MNGPRGLSVDAMGATGVTGATALGPTATFSSVDLDVWATDFLAAVDLYLSPRYAVPLAQLSGPSGGVGITAINQLIAAKESLADAISRTVTEVLSGPTGGVALSDAQEAVRQQLLVNLSSGYATNAVIWSPFSVTGPTGFASPPRLSGTPVDVGGSPTGPTGGAFGLSTAKVPLQAQSAASFLFNVQAAAEHKYVPLDLDYVVSEVEHDIHDVPGITGYQASSWLTLILPDRPTDGSTIGPVGATSVHLDTRIGVSTSRSPSGHTRRRRRCSRSRRRPRTRRSARRRRQAWIAPSSGTTRSATARNRQNRTRSTSRWPSTSGRPLRSVARCRASGPVRLAGAIRHCLPRSADRDLASVPDDGGGPAAAGAISVLADLATEIADTWSTYPPVGPARVLQPGMTAEVYTYRMRAASDTTSQQLTSLTMEQLAAADVDIGWPRSRTSDPRAPTSCP